MKFLLGTKEYMTQVYDKDGTVHVVTVVSAGPITVTQVKSEETDGYVAAQVGYGNRKEKNINKAQKGHLKGMGDFMYLKEYRPEQGEDFAVAVGDTVDLSVFEEGTQVTVSSVSKGKGFQGGVKRHGFAGGRRTHGQKHSEREPGSIGATGPQRVFKGTKMAGRMGTDRVTVKGLDIVKVDTEAGHLYIKGAIPGTKGSLVEIRA